MLRPKLSIIITCYNLGHYLEEAIASIKYYSSFEDYEIILVNDGSTDKATLQILEKIEQKDKSIFVLHQANIGLAKARNNGIKLAKGKYIIPLDADNKLRPECIKQTIAVLDSNLGIDVVHGDTQLFGNKNSVWKGKPFDVAEMVLNNYIDACAGFRKSVWEELRGYDENMPVMGFEDWDLWLRMAVRGCRFQYVETTFFDYRVRDNSMLAEAWKERPLLLGYIFNKKELRHLFYFRECLIENKKLKEEPALKEILQIIIKKIKRKLHF
ncbi:glycosyltransferase family A protein [Flavobacterium sp. Arc3]|uniref:glycosyltransferase family 2 protein n=1 Tax=Flavobacterium sp. Arc3 TaxID=3046686 RepID=UPI00352C0A3D